MMSRFVGVGAFVAMFGLVSAIGCSSNPAPGEGATGSGGQAIQGGTTDTTHTYAVGVCGGSPGNCQLFCSGTLIAPNLVVTARHCVSQVPAGNVDCATTNFGAQYNPAQFYVTTNTSMNGGGASGWYQASKFVTPGPTLLCGNDLALIVLKTNVPASAATPITPNVIYDLRDHAHLSTTEVAVGYGISAPNTNTQGTRRIRQNIQIVCIPHDPSIDCYSDPQASQYIKDAEYEAGDGTCEGDSGSGAYEQLSFNNGQPIVLGALSRGGVSQDGTTCQGAVYTRLDSWRQLIIDTAKSAASAGGYTPPAWVNSAPPSFGADGGTTPPKDGGGTNPGSDGGTSSGGKPLGDACDTNDECDSNTCSATDGKTFVCTEACGTGDSCPDGFTCKSGYCFAGTKPSSSGATPTSQSSGCAIATPSTAKDPSKPIPWVFAVAGAALIAAGLRRRRNK